MEYLPYTYLIGWGRLHTFYYGCEYSKNAGRVAHPSNLWSSYFTSSKHVRKFREEHGEPDIIQIRKTLKVKGYAVSDSTRDKISESGKGVPQPASFVEKMKNKIWITDGIITKRIFSNEMIPEGWVKGRPYHWQNVRNILYIVKDTQSNQEELITRQDFLKRVGIVSSSVRMSEISRNHKI